MSSHVSLTLYILRSHISIIVSINEPDPASLYCQMYLFTTRVRGPTSMIYYYSSISTAVKNSDATMLRKATCL